MVSTTGSGADCSVTTVSAIGSAAGSGTTEAGCSTATGSATGCDAATTEPQNPQNLELSLISLPQFIQNIK